MGFSSTSKRTLIIIGVVSIAFILMPFVFAPTNYNSQNYFSSVRFYRMLTENTLLVVFFYLNYFLFTSEYYFKKKYILYAFLICFSFLIVYQVPDYLFPIDREVRISARFGSRRPPMFMIWSPKVLMFLCMTMISLFLRQNQRYQEVKEEKQLSEIAYLRAQINPHFLFNTLNNIYALTLQKSDSASDAVMKLSKMMRFVVSESSKDFVPLAQDLDYIKNYIQLQQLRLTNKDSIQYSVVGNALGLSISPLILINFIENAFKYGIMDDVSHPICISINIDQQTLVLQVKNSISDQNIPDHIKTEIGLKNTEKRLSYLYANAFVLRIENDGKYFNVHLKIKLND